MDHPILAYFTIGALVCYSIYYLYKFIRYLRCKFGPDCTLCAHHGIFSAPDGCDYDVCDKDDLGMRDAPVCERVCGGIFCDFKYLE